MLPKAFPKALFSLAPINPKARAATSDARNEDRAYKIPGEEIAIAIGFDSLSRAGNSYTLATLGRGHDVDIYVGGSMISKIQCSFEMNLDTSVVMLYDRSTAQTTQVHGQNATPFQHTREPPRRVVIDQELNDIITLGGAARDLVQFRVIWHQSLAEALAATDTEKRSIVPQGYMEEVAYNPRVAHTLSQELETELPSRMETRTHTPKQMQMRYKKLHPLGSGSFGEVFKVWNLQISFSSVLLSPGSPSGQRGIRDVRLWQSTSPMTG